MKYGYLFSGYKTSLYYWELVTIITKVLLVMVTLYLKEVSPESQVLVGLLLLILFMILQVRFRPFATMRLNNLQLSSIMVTSLTMYAGMFYVTGNHYTYMRGNGGLKWFFLMLIILTNSAFFLYCLNLLRIELLKLALSSSKRLFSVLSLGLLDPTDFEKVHMKKEEDSEIHQTARDLTYIVDQESSKRVKRASAPDGAGDFDDIRGGKYNSSSDSEDRGRGSVEPNYDTEGG